MFQSVFVQSLCFYGMCPESDQQQFIFIKHMRKHSIIKHSEYILIEMFDHDVYQDFCSHVWGILWKLVCRHCWMNSFGIHQMFMILMKVGRICEVLVEVFLLSRHHHPCFIFCCLWFTLCVLCLFISPWSFHSTSYNNNIFLIFRRERVF